MTTLTAPERRDLTESQARKLADKIKASATNLADLLCQFHAGQGWTALGYATWKECCEAEFRLSPSYAHRLMRAEEVRARLPIDNAVNEAQARELAKLPEDEQPTAWQETVERCGGAENVTAAAVRETVEQREGEPEEDDDESEPVEPSFCDALDALVELFHDTHEKPWCTITSVLRHKLEWCEEQRD